jgi:hypothetical protein
MDNQLSGLSAGAVTAIVLVSIAVWAVMLFAYVSIIRRAGYSGWWVLIGLVPIANIVMFLVFAFKEWPVQRELAQLRGLRGGAPGTQATASW